MDNRGYKPNGFGYTREIKSNRSRQNHPSNDENNEDAYSLHSIEQNTSPNQETTPFESIPRTKSNNSRKHYDKLSTVSTKGLFIVGGIILVICLILIIPTVLGVVLTRNPAVTGKTSTTTIALNMTSVYWSFDSNADDMYGFYGGVLQNGAQYSNTTYFAYGSCLMLNSSTNDSVIVTSRFLNLTYTSFTIEAWVYGLTLNGDNTIFSQCACFTCQDQCLHLMIRNYKLYMGFMMDDVIGLASLSINTWYHVAFVYDYSTRTQSVYLQGVLDNSKSSAGPYQGGNASIMIGSSRVLNGAFNGYIDNLKVITRAKSASELLTAGTTVVYFSFDGSTLSEDMGPNKLNGTISNAGAVTGKSGQGLLFSGASTSYLLIPGFQQIGLGNRPVSISLWVNPYSITGGVLMQRHSYLNTTYSCYSMMGLNYMGQISMIIYASNAPLIVGPILSIRTWTHLGFTYNSTNGLRMYVNGVFIGTTGSTSWLSAGAIEYLVIGAYPYGYCGQGAFTISVTPFYGVIDDLYVYRRELTASEISTLASS